ncbi:hypothetical protein KEM55_002081 [Ascosphaera atra]|nr:hypothetical protein KEM55_002081 [Ascosphaera atra]
MWEAGVQDVAAVLLDVEDGQLDFFVDEDAAGVVLLTTLLGVEVGAVKDHTNARVVRHAAGVVDELAVVVDRLDGGGDVVSAVLGGVVGLGDVVGGIELADVVDGKLDGLFGGLALALASLAGLETGLLELGVVDSQAALLTHELREIDREPIGIVQPPNISTMKLRNIVLLRLLSVILKQLLTTIQRLGERNLLLIQNLTDISLLALKLREHIAHLLDERRDDLGEEAPDVDAQVLAGISCASAEDAADDVAAALVVWWGAVGDGETQGADVVGDDSVGGVDAICVLGGELAGVRADAGDLADLVEQGGEDVGVVVGGLVLEDGHETLVAHAGVDVFGGEGLEGGVRLAVVLDEDVVPDLKDIRVVLVDERRGIAAPDPVVVDLAARAARALVAHLPEVILHVAGEDVVFSDADVEPALSGLVVGLEAGLGLAFEVGDVEAVRVEAVDFDQEVPGVSDGVALEVVAEGPVA